MKTRVSGRKAILQVQPEARLRNQWKALAEQENLRFEVMELSCPPVLNDPGSSASCAGWYRRSRRAESFHGVFIDINPASSDHMIRSLSRRRCRQSCETALLTGAGNVVFHSSCFPFLRGSYLETWADLCAEFYEELVRSYPLKVFIENSQDIDARPLRELMRRIRDHRVGVCLDVGHANYSEMPLRQWFEDLGDRIGYLHLSDNNGLYDDHLSLGEGTVDWEAVEDFWQAADKTMPVTLETGGIDGTRRSLKFLREHGYLSCREG